MHIRWEPLLFRGKGEKEITMNNQNTYIYEYMYFLFIGSRERAKHKAVKYISVRMNEWIGIKEEYGISNEWQNKFERGKMQWHWRIAWL